MRILRKYWFMVFLMLVFWACVIALLVPSEEKEIRTLVATAFAVMCLWYVLSQLDRIEHKLDALLQAGHSDNPTEQKKGSG